MATTDMDRESGTAAETAQPRRPHPIAFRDREVEDQLRQRASAGRSPAQVAARDLARYYALLHRSLPAFSAPDASLIVDACNGWFVEPHSAPLLWAEVADAISLDGLDAKWGVDGPALVARLRALTPFEALAVCDAIERAWKHLGAGEDIAATLRAIGLVRGG